MSAELALVVAPALMAFYFLQQAKLYGGDGSGQKNWGIAMRMLYLFISQAIMITVPFVGYHVANESANFQPLTDMYLYITVGAGVWVLAFALFVYFLYRMKTAMQDAAGKNDFKGLTDSR